MLADLRRVRKCLWANEEDEAFVDDDEDQCEEPVVPREPPKTPTKDQLARRQKDIDYGKATSGYKNYLERVPKEQRGNLCPQTPEKNEKVARRVWDITVRNWRRTLHQWDVPAKESTPLSSPSKIPTRRSRPGRSRLSPASSVTSSPSDRGYVTTPDSRGDRSLLDEEDDFLFVEMEDFPPLPSGQHGKPWWEIVEEEEKAKEEAEAEEMEEEPLDQIVKNLSITNPDTEKEGDEETEEQLQE
ncbi:uncharacterized protein LOC143294193 [Babylonia areolata]|uniref:uncharacterized protein LOC143294193 n=1 Tax=Babylonia areolata TaxID=304850 RepID=UPI003FD38064